VALPLQFRQQCAAYWAPGGDIGNAAASIHRNDSSMATFDRIKAARFVPGRSKKFCFIWGVQIFVNMHNNIERLLWRYASQAWTWVKANCIGRLHFHELFD
jgi:hypothetical protein